MRAHNSAHNRNPLLTSLSSVLSTRSSFPCQLEYGGCSGYYKTLCSLGKSGLSVWSLCLPYPKATLLLEAAFILAKRQGLASRRKALEGSHSTMTLQQWTLQKEICLLVHLTFPKGPPGPAPALGSRGPKQAQFFLPVSRHQWRRKTHKQMTCLRDGTKV